MSKVVYDYLEDLEYDFKNIMNLSKVMQDKSDAYQREMAEEFDCSVTAIQKALKRLGITRKKRQLNTRSRILKK